MKKYISFLALVTALSLLFCSCNSLEFTNDGNYESLFDDGLAEFVNDREEEYPSFDDPGISLDELIEKYSGGFSLPEVVEDPDPDPVLPDENPDDGSGVEGNDFVEYPKALSCLDDLVQAADACYMNLEDKDVVLELTNGYEVSFSDIEAAMELAEVYQPVWSAFVSCWHYSTYSIGGKDYFCLNVDYYESKAQMKKYFDATFAKAKEVEKQLGLVSKSDYERVLAVNDYLCETCRYDYADDRPQKSHSAYGALVDGLCVCDGYARAAWLLINDTGGSCKMVVGIVRSDNKTAGHAWNMAKVDGKWYQLDICWNDTDGYENNEYFLVDDKHMMESRMWKSEFYPVCNSGSYKH